MEHGIQFTDFGNSRDERLEVDFLIMQSIAHGDDRALGQLYDRYARLLLGVIMNVVRKQAEAEDLLQEVFMQIWRKAGTYDRKLGTPSMWLVRIARNKAIDCVRSKRMRATNAEVVIDESVALPASGKEVNPEEVMISGQVKDLVKQALNLLPPEQRKLIELAYYEGYSQSELAAALSLPLGTVKSRVRLGMLALHKQLSSIKEPPHSLIEN